MFSIIWNFIVTHLLSLAGLNGGAMATVGVALLIFNIVMSCIQSVFNALSKTEPAWLQKIGSVGATITGWLSANVPSVKAKVEQK